MYNSGEEIPYGTVIDEKSFYTLNSAIPDITRSDFEDFLLDISDDSYEYEFKESLYGDEKLNTPLEVLSLKNSPSPIYIVTGIQGSGFFKTVRFISQNPITGKWKKVYEKSLGQLYSENYIRICFFNVDDSCYSFEVTDFGASINKLDFDKKNNKVIEKQIAYFENQKNVFLPSEIKNIVTSYAVNKFLQRKYNQIDYDYENYIIRIKTDYGILNGQYFNGHPTDYKSVIDLDSITTKEKRTMHIGEINATSFVNCVYYYHNGPKLLVDDFFDTRNYDKECFAVLDLQTLRWTKLENISISSEYVLIKK